MQEQRKEEGRWNKGVWETTHVGATKTGEDVARAQDTEKLGSTAGKGLGARERKPVSGTPMPKQAPGEDPVAYGARLRRWREGEKGEKGTVQQEAFKKP